jgi:hypothetical protein
MTEKDWKNFPLVGPETQKAFNELDALDALFKARRERDLGSNKPDEFPGEPCCGCGRSGNHPMAVIRNDEETRELAIFPVCLPCWQVPSSQRFKIIGHFWPREQVEAAFALLKDQKNQIGG